MSDIDDLRQLTETIQCPWCIAKPGEPCYIDIGNGRVSQSTGLVHLARSIPFSPAGGR